MADFMDKWLGWKKPGPGVPISWGVPDMLYSSHYEITCFIYQHDILFKNIHGVKRWRLQNINYLFHNGWPSFWKAKSSAETHFQGFFRSHWWFIFLWKWLQFSAPSWNVFGTSNSNKEFQMVLSILCFSNFNQFFK